MGEFIFNRGRSKTAHSYPENTRAAAADVFARNSAIFVSEGTAIPATPGAQISWSSIASGGSGVDVRITPKSTGNLRITGTVTVINGNGAPRTVTVQVEYGGGVVIGAPVNSEQTVDATPAEATIPIFIETGPGITPVGTTSEIEIRLIGSDTGVNVIAAQLDIQEVGPITG